MPQIPDYLLTLTGAAATVPVSLADAKEQCRVDSDDTASNDLITAYVLAATKLVEEESGKKLITQTWKATYKKPPYGTVLHLPVHPVASITSIDYYDAANSATVFSSSNYLLQKDEDHAWIETASGVNWPNVYDRSDAFSVTFVTGFGDADAVPANLVHAIKMAVAQWFEHRGDDGPDIEQLPPAARDLIALSKKGWVAA